MLLSRLWQYGSDGDNLEHSRIGSQNRHEWCTRETKTHWAIRAKNYDEVRLMYWSHMYWCYVLRYPSILYRKAMPLASVNYIWYGSGPIFLKLSSLGASVRVKKVIHVTWIRFYVWLESSSWLKYDLNWIDRVIYLTQLNGIYLEIEIDCVGNLLSFTKVFTLVKDKRLEKLLV